MKAEEYFQSNDKFQTKYWVFFLKEESLDWKAWINVFISEATYNPYWSNSTLLYLFDLCRPRSKQGTKSTVWCTIATNHLLFYFTGVTPLYFSILVLSLVKSCMLVRLVLNCLISWLYIVNCFPVLFNVFGLHLCLCGINESTFGFYYWKPLIDFVCNLSVHRDVVCDFKHSHNVPIAHDTGSRDTGTH